ncbi:hypothetical protein GGF45_002613 [Coemansia sp. RSA 551]|nr:hypothetical protein GGF45_002613 [Coemansia sp. RSA 551]
MPNDDDAVLVTLRRALAHTQTSSDRAKVELAVELRTHYISERQTTCTSLDRLQRNVHRLRVQYDQALSSQARDISQLHKIQASNRFTQTLSASRKTNTKESLNFSNMMVESACLNMQQAERELEDNRSKWERSVERLRNEAELAVRACEDVVARVPDRQANKSELQMLPLVSNGIFPPRVSNGARPPLPRPPPIPAVFNNAQKPLPVPKPARGVVRKPLPVPSTSSNNQKVVPVKPPRIISQMALPAKPPRTPAVPNIRLTPVLTVTESPSYIIPKAPARDPESLAPAHAKQKRIRPFKIESEDRHQSMRMTAQQQRFQAQIPRLYLGAIPFEKLDTRDSVYNLLFKDLWPSIRGMLKLCFANTMVRLTAGVRGFGADAYLELKQEQRQLRIPVCIVGRDFGAGSAPVHRVDGVQSVQMSFGPQEVSTPQLLSAAQSLVLRTVQLISTEVRANNVGMLLTPSGLMFVRRTHKQTALISRLHSYVRSDSASFWCHPVAAIGCCIAQILASGPTDALEPPMY